MRIRYYWMLIVLFLLTTFLSARALNMDALWLDEYWTLHIAGGGYEGPLTLPQVWERAVKEDSYWPPGYAFIYSMWGSEVGWTPFGGRALSLFVGILAVAWTYRLGTDLFTRRAGLIAALLIGTSAYFIYFLHELRAYAFFVMLIAMTVWVYWRIINGRGKWGSYLLLFLGSLALLYTNYLAALTLVVLGIYHILFGPKNRQGALVVLAMSLPGLLFVPWLADFLSALAFANNDVNRQAFAFTPLQSAKGVLYMFSNGCVALLALFGLYSFGRKSSLRFAWFWGIGIFVLLILVNARFGIILEVRYLFPVWPAVAVIAGYGADRLLSDYRRPALVMIGIWVLAGVWNSIDPASIQDMHNPQWHLPWNVLVDQLKPHAEPEDALAFVLPDWTWSVYHTPVFNYYLHDTPLLRHTLMERPENIGFDIYKQQFQSLVSGNPKLWVAYSGSQPTIQMDYFKSVLSSGNYLQCTTVFESPDIHLDLYAPPDLKSQIEPVHFGDDGIRLGSLTASVHPDQRSLEITQIWSVAAGVTPYKYSVGLHIDNTQGQLVAQTDYALPMQGDACHWTSLDLQGLPSGEYKLLVVVYAWETGERLPASSDTASNPVDRFVVSNFTLP